MCVCVLRHTALSLPLSLLPITDEAARDGCVTTPQVADAPSRAIYASLSDLAGATAVSCAAPSAKLDAAAWAAQVQAKITAKTVMLVVASPCRVTGQMLPAAYLTAALRLCRSAGRWRPSLTRRGRGVRVRVCLRWISSM